MAQQLRDLPSLGGPDVFPCSRAAATWQGLMTRARKSMNKRGEPAAPTDLSSFGHRIRGDGQSPEGGDAGNLTWQSQLYSYNADLVNKQ